MAFLKVLIFLTMGMVVVSAKSDLWTSTKDFSNFNVVKNLWNGINVTNDPGTVRANFIMSIFLYIALIHQCNYKKLGSNTFELFYAVQRNSNK